MATFDSLFPSLATRLIDRFGASASLQTVSRTDDLATGQVSEVTNAANVKITPPEPFTVGLIDGTLVEAGDMTTLLAAAGLNAPPVAQRDRLRFALATWQIVAVSPVYSGNVAAAYRLQLRR